MLYQQLQDLNPIAFGRASGVKRETFLAMVKVFRPTLERHGKRGGQNRLSVEDQLLIALQYWRQYRTQFDIGLEFEVSEATVCRTIEKVETLVKSGRFRLPGKRQLQQAETSWEVVGIDVTEVSIERPKKNSELTTAASTSATRSKPNWSLTLSRGSFSQLPQAKGAHTT
jgi:hypothetical protein